VVDPRQKVSGGLTAATDHQRQMRIGQGLFDGAQGRPGHDDVAQVVEAHGQDATDVLPTLVE
jgi:hypothetical protein